MRYSIESIARAFHEEYERRAGEFNYKTHGWTAWEAAPTENRRLMIATVTALVARGVIRPGTEGITASSKTGGTPE